VEGYCSIHPQIMTPQQCQGCFKTWPKGQNKNYQRAQCKRKNWIGEVDVGCINRKPRKVEA